jgi:hypothetical protein
MKCIANRYSSGAKQRPVELTYCQPYDTCGLTFSKAEEKNIITINHSIRI